MFLRQVSIFDLQSMQKKNMYKYIYEYIGVLVFIEDSKLDVFSRVKKI